MKTKIFKNLLPTMVFLFGVAVFAFRPPAPLVVADAPEKVTICHASDSASNPYQINKPAKSADVAGHNDHTGPVAYSQAYATQLKEDDIKWGDIIPPFSIPGSDEMYPGLNWTTVGKAVWNNNCGFVTAVTPTAATFVDPTCTVSGSYTITASSNVTYQVGDSEVTAGTYTATNGSTITVTAHPISNEFYFADGTVTEWTHTFTTPNCSVTPAAVTFTNPTCSVKGTYTVPMTLHVFYMLGSNTVAAGSYSAANGSTVTINAATDNGYSFVTGVTSAWSNTFTAPTNCTGVLGDTTTRTVTPAVAGVSKQVSATPVGAVDAGSAENVLFSLSGLIGSLGLLIAGFAVKKQN